MSAILETARTLFRNLVPEHPETKYPDFDIYDARKREVAEYLQHTFPDHFTLETSENAALLLKDMTWGVQRQYTLEHPGYPTLRVPKTPILPTLYYNGTNHSVNIPLEDLKRFAELVPTKVYKFLNHSGDVSFNGTPREYMRFVGGEEGRHAYEHTLGLTTPVIREYHLADMIDHDAADVEYHMLQHLLEWVNTDRQYFPRTNTTPIITRIDMATSKRNVSSVPSVIYQAS